MTQPPLTRHVQGLEHELGAMLLDRGRRAVRLTPAGENFARSARHLLEQAADAARDARQIAAGDAGALTIAFTAASSYAFVPSLIARIRRAFPDLALTLREMTTPQQLDALKAGQVDLRLLRPPLSLPGVRGIRVYREELVSAVPERHALARRAEVAMSDLAGETLIIYPPVEGPYFHRLVTGLLNVAGVQPAETQFITQTLSILALVGEDLGVAIVPQAAEKCLPKGVALPPLSGAEGVHADLLLAWREGSANPACASVLGLVEPHRIAG